MAGARNNNFENPPTKLSPTQQDLLLAALASNNPNNSKQLSNGNGSFDMAHANSFDSFGNVDLTNSDFFASPQALGSVNPMSFDQSPFDDLLDGETNLDYDTTEGDLMIGGLPGDDGTIAESDLHEKRKSPDDAGDEPEGSSKRNQNGETREAKKPGRKPLTSEPTTKRKAQNRAAQRAFRERKEKHLHDLETKVEELEKKSESANHENGLLRAQVTRLQTELREYRKRLSLGGLKQSPTSFGSTMGINSSNNFQFEFPRFGSLPGAPVMDSLSKSTSPPANKSNGMATGALRNPSMSDSPQSNPSPGQNSSKNDLANAMRFDYGFPTSAHDNSSTAENNNQTQRVFRFNSATSSTGSPSASSISQYGQNSSCDTSPEPSHNSPSNTTKQGGGENTNLDTINEGYVCHGNSEGEITFCEKLNMACGNPRNPVPRAMSHSSSRSRKNSNGKPAASAANATNDLPGFDFFATQNGGGFDPLLFGDYRESQAAIVGTGEDFSNGFFNDAFGFPDLNSPFNYGDTGTGLTPAINTSNKPNPIEQVEKLQDGIEDDEVVPGEDTSQMLSCHKIWDKLQDRADFKDGSFDIDGLCSELRSKARCSETGVVVDQKDVDAALKRLPFKEQNNTRAKFEKYTEQLKQKHQQKQQV